MQQNRPSGKYASSARPAPFYNQIPNYERPTGHMGDPFETSKRVAEWIAKHPSPIKPWDIDELLRMVMDAPRYRMNTVVWNQVISLLGKEHKLEVMFRALNHVSVRALKLADLPSKSSWKMKKRSYKPNSRTYTIMLNAYTGARHLDEDVAFTPSEKPSEKLWQRILTVYNESQANISACIAEAKKAKEQGKDVHFGTKIDTSPRVEGEPRVQPTRLEEITEQINPSPTNAYLKLLARYGMWAQMDKVHVAMDQEGPLSANTKTYTILLHALLNRRAQQEEKRWTHVKNDLTKFMSPDEFGSTARSLWDEVVRKFHPIVPSDTHIYARDRRIDEELALLAMRAFLTARPADQLLATNLIPFIWGLPDLKSAVPASFSASMKDSKTAARDNIDIPHYMKNIPRLKPTVRSASSLLVMLGKANKVSLASHWAKYFFSLPELRSQMDFQFVRSVIHALASTGDVDQINDIMETYQPPTGKAGWHAYIWENVLMAARQKMDFEAAMDAFRRMTHLPNGVEDGVPVEQRTKYLLPSRSGAKTRDVHGHNFIRPDRMEPTAKALSLLFKTAFLSTSATVVDRNTRKAFNTLTAFNLDKMFTIPADDYKRGTTIRLLQDKADDFDGEVHNSLVAAAEWRLSLAKDVERAMELLMDQAEAEEKRPLWELKEKMANIGRTWARILDPKVSSRLVGTKVKGRPKPRDEFAMPASHDQEGQTNMQEGSDDLVEDDEDAADMDAWMQGVEDIEGDTDGDSARGDAHKGRGRFRKNTVGGRARHA